MTFIAEIKIQLSIFILTRVRCSRQGRVKGRPLSGRLLATTPFYTNGGLPTITRPSIRWYNRNSKTMVPRLI